MENINEMTPGNGRMLGESEVVNVADLQNNAFKGAFGRSGTKNITGTIATVPDAGKVFIALQAIEDCVLDATAGLIESNSTGSLNGKTIPAGMTLYGVFTSVKLTLGTMRAYQGVAL